MAVLANFSLKFSQVKPDDVTIGSLPTKTTNHLMQPQVIALNQPLPRLLLIDDDASVRRSISMFLADSGFTVFEAQNGAQGVALFNSEQPDLVLCDLKLPDANGLDIISELASAKEDTPVIVISGYGGIGDVVRALRLGASDYLMKPIKDLEVLEHSIRRGLQQSALVEENKRYAKQLESTNLQLRHSLDLLQLDQQAGLLVQTRLLPNTPMQGVGYECQHKIVPSLYLSGDFVDYWELENGNLVFYIADVSGHGASSAFVTVLLKYMARDITRRAYRKSTAISTAEILGKLSKELLRANLQKHATAFFGLIDFQNSVFSYSAAGHYPMPIINQGDEFRMLEAQSFPMGVQEGAEYETTQLTTEGLSSINLFSDGVLELIQEKTLADKEQQLIEYVTSSNGNFEGVFARLQLSSVSEAPDDVALLSIKLG